MIKLGVSSGSSIQLLIFQALKQYDSRALFPYLEDRSATVRSSAARELQVRGEALSFDRAVFLADSPTAFKREIAAFLLGQLATPKFRFKKQSVPVLERLLADQDADVRAAAAAGLGHLRSRSSIPFLLKKVSDPDARVRACVAFAFQEFTNHPLVGRAISKLQKDVDPNVRLWAAKD